VNYKIAFFTSWMKFSTEASTHYQYLYYVVDLVRYILPNIASTSFPWICDFQSSAPNQVTVVGVEHFSYGILK